MTTVILFLYTLFTLCFILLESGHEVNIGYKNSFLPIQSPPLVILDLFLDPTFIDFFIFQVILLLYKIYSFLLNKHLKGPWIYTFYIIILFIKN